MEQYQRMYDDEHLEKKINAVDIFRLDYSRFSH